MIFDRMEKVKVTSDIRKVLPGMVFVDLTDKKNNRDIYRAYQNGAELIFTSRNVSDPDLPVIKVSNPHEIYLKLLNKYYEYPQNSASLIALGGSSDKNAALNMLETILNSVHSNPNGFKLDWFKSHSGKLLKSVEEMFDYLYAKVHLGIETIPIAVEKSMELEFQTSGLSFDCCILTNGLDKEEAMFENIINRLKTNHPVIINADVPELFKAVEDRKDILVITYGLTKKACVTASSIDFADTASFNYCLQRTIYTQKGKCIEPFEMPFEVRLLGKHNVCNALAAITCALYFDLDIEEIQKALLSFEPSKRKFEKIFEGEFKVVDDYCTSPIDLNETLEAIQILNYDRLLIVFSPNSEADFDTHRENAKIIFNWAKVLGCKELILSSCMDNLLTNASAQNKIIKMYKNELKKEDIPVKYYHLLQHSIEYSLKKVEQRDLILVIGGEEMSPAAEILLFGHLR